MSETLNKFSMEGKVVIVTGGAGLLGKRHSEAVAESGGIPILIDINGDAAKTASKDISARFNIPSMGLEVDISKKDNICEALDLVLREFGRVNVLINNAANNPGFQTDCLDTSWSRFENFPVEIWDADIMVGLTGAFLCSQIFGRNMAEQGGGVILNISSDLGLIAPDQRLYKKPGLPDEMQPVKPVSYSVIKHGIIGLTKYLATYWADRNVRANALCPGGVFNDQPEDFVLKITNLIPLKRMARVDDYKAAVIFLISDASSYMTGQTLVIDGGRTCW